MATVVTPPVRNVVMSPTNNLSIEQSTKSISKISHEKKPSDKFALKDDLYDRELQILGIAGILLTLLSLQSFLDGVLSAEPTPTPSRFPIAIPSAAPTISFPSKAPAFMPSGKPSATPTISKMPSDRPTADPTRTEPSAAPSNNPNVLDLLAQVTQFLDNLWFTFFLSFING